MLVESVNIQGMLSFREMTLALRPLNILIGPNASGKSNLIEIFALLQSVPRDLPAFFRRSGGIGDWLWKGKQTIHNQSSIAVLDVLLENPVNSNSIRYAMAIAERNQQFDIVEERLANEYPFPGHEEPYHFFQVSGGYGMIRISDPEGFSGRTHAISPDDLTPGQSVLRERKDPALYPELTQVGRSLDSIRLYREWNLGRSANKVRTPQPTDLPNDFLEEDFSNLALVLNQLQRGPSIKEIEENLKRFYDNFEQINASIEANTAQLWIREKGLSSVIPATRLSDGTLRFLSLLIVLCHPKPPPLICIEEPELGLHPDIIPQIAELLKSASERTQLIVTTHSERLIDELSDDPESVVVCERGTDSSSEFRRLSSQELKLWLENYSLGELWSKGEIGGTRW